MIGAGYYAETEVEELGGRASLDLLEENVGTERMRHLVIRNRVRPLTISDIAAAFDAAVAVAA